MPLPAARRARVGSGWCCGRPQLGNGRRQLSGPRIGCKPLGKGLTVWPETAATQAIAPQGEWQGGADVLPRVLCRVVAVLEPDARSFRPAKRPDSIPLAGNADQRPHGAHQGRGLSPLLKGFRRVAPVLKAFLLPMARPLRFRRAFGIGRSACGGPCFTAGAVLNSPAAICRASKPRRSGAYVNGSRRA
jgi:hypothetical protein